MIGAQFSVGMGIFLLDTVSRPALERTQPPIQWIKRALSSEVKAAGATSKSAWS
jgi:hypothetical protein